MADLAGKVVAVDVTAAGGVKWHEQDEAGDHQPLATDIYALRLPKMCSCSKLTRASSRF